MKNFTIYELVMSSIVLLEAVYLVVSMRRISRRLTKNRGGGE